jgi:hypothetical protein
MPNIPDDMSEAAKQRRRELSAKLRADAVKDAAANPPAAPKPRIAKGR